ncbi:MAG: bifunctional phosphopantothenoylcysteine decarboxylase/phosphopantothenate--cysteine ligase CoaBC [Clostridiales bacterium]|nr:bifunctional phosphopantothenoylcysteine decarboxylase/phosphopantothenate--cysteine ligase CoaBC [Clostridiales bacterium]
MLTDKKIALGVTGGIAAYRAAELIGLLKKRGAQVRVVMTVHATEFIAPLTLETLSGYPVSLDLFAPRDNMAHISLAKWADILAVAPATASCLGKFANGIADDLLSTAMMAMRCPVLLAPAMNTAMWNCRANQRNVETLSRWGVRFIGPARGKLACGDEDVGRMAEPEDIVEAIGKILHPLRDFERKRVLVTAGPTREMLDPVRFLSNRSSGKMGFAIAEAARDRGAEVTLISGPVTLRAPEGVEYVSITSAAELSERVLASAEAADIVIQAAAPADFRPRSVSPTKIKKSGAGLTLELENTADVAQALGERKRPGQILVAFAAETNDLQKNALKKLEKKNADLVVANDITRPGAGFQSDTNAVTLFSRVDAREIPMSGKREIAEAILNRIAEMF